MYYPYTVQGINTGIPGLPPFNTLPGGVNPDPLALLQQAYQSICQQIAQLSITFRPDYTVDGVTIPWSTYVGQLLDREEYLRKIPGVAPTIEAPYMVIQLTGVVGWNGSGGGFNCGW